MRDRITDSRGDCSALILFTPRGPRAGRPHTFARVPDTFADFRNIFARAWDGASRVSTVSPVLSRRCGATAARGYRRTRLAERRRDNTAQAAELLRPQRKPRRPACNAKSIRDLAWSAASAASLMRRPPTTRSLAPRDTACATTESSAVLGEPSLVRWESQPEPCRGVIAALG